jgi:hypothetical protein
MILKEVVRLRGLTTFSIYQIEIPFQKTFRKINLFLTKRLLSKLRYN